MTDALDEMTTNPPADMCWRCRGTGYINDGDECFSCDALGRLRLFAQEEDEDARGD